jgi:hypothetical protein
VVLNQKQFLYIVELNDDVAGSCNSYQLLLLLVASSSPSHTSSFNSYSKILMNAIDNSGCCHPEHSEGSVVNNQGIVQTSSNITVVHNAVQRFLAALGMTSLRRE